MCEQCGTTVASWQQIDGEERGYRLEENDVYIGRAMPRYRMHGSVWANPFKMRDQSTKERARVIGAYEAYIRQKLNADVTLKRQLWALRGKRLICWCAPKPCHGHVLLKLIAEAEAWVEAKQVFAEDADIECHVVTINGDKRFYWRDGRVTSSMFD